MSISHSPPLLPPTLIPQTCLLWWCLCVFAEFYSVVYVQQNCTDAWNKSEEGQFWFQENKLFQFRLRKSPFHVPLNPVLVSINSSISFAHPQKPTPAEGKVTLPLAAIRLPGRCTLSLVSLWPPWGCSSGPRDETPFSFGEDRVGAG